MSKHEHICREGVGRNSFCCVHIKSARVCQIQWIPLFPELHKAGCHNLKSKQTLNFVYIWTRFLHKLMTWTGKPIRTKLWGQTEVLNGSDISRKAENHCRMTLRRKRPAVAHNEETTAHIWEVIWKDHMCMSDEIT